MLWNRYCIIVRISPNWPPRPSCSAFAAAGSGSSTTISLMSCWVCKYISLLGLLDLCDADRLGVGGQRSGPLDVSLCVLRLRPSAIPSVPNLVGVLGVLAGWAAVI